MKRACAGFFRSSIHKRKSNKNLSNTMEPQNLQQKQQKLLQKSLKIERRQMCKAKNTTICEARIANSKRRSDRKYCSLNRFQIIFNFQDVFFYLV